MHAQLSAGIRGLECVSRAIGILLGDYVERDIKPDWPEGWAPDVEPFYCGLDKTTMELTPQDLKNIEQWYERTIGWQPPRVRFLAKYEPVTLKSWRAKWEGVFRGALPKQMMPYLSLRHNIVIGNPGGLKEVALLAKAWGVTNAIIVNTIIQGAYYFCGRVRRVDVHGCGVIQPLRVHRGIGHAFEIELDVGAGKWAAGVELHAGTERQREL